MRSVAQTACIMVGTAWLAWSPEVVASYPSDIEAARRACRDNNHPTDDPPEVQACKRAAAYFVSVGGPEGYVRLYTWRACKLSTPAACKRLKVSLQQLARSKAACDVDSKSSRCRGLTALVDALARVPLPSKRPMLVRQRKKTTPIARRGAASGRPDRSLTALPPRAAVAAEGRRAMVSCLVNGLPSACVALASHAVVTDQDKALREAAERRLCALQSTGPCEQTLWRLDEFASSAAVSSTPSRVRSLAAPCESSG